MISVDIKGNCVRRHRKTTIRRTRFTQCSEIRVHCEENSLQDSRTLLGSGGRISRIADLEAILVCPSPGHNRYGRWQARIRRSGSASARGGEHGLGSLTDTYTCSIAAPAGVLEPARRIPGSRERRPGGAGAVRCHASWLERLLYLALPCRATAPARPAEGIAAVAGREANIP